MLQLSIPPENAFISIKMQWKERAKTVPRTVVAEIKQGTWLTSILWKDYGWKYILEKHGVTWPKFMELYRYASYAFVEWVFDKRSWQEAIQVLINVVIEAL